MNFTINNPEFEPPKKKWFYRFDLKACLRQDLMGGTELHTREFTMPFEHPDWHGPFDNQIIAYAAGEKSFRSFVDARGHNRHDPRKMPI